MSKNINEILAKHYGGTYATIRFVELMHDNKGKIEKEKTGDEIAMDIIRRAGLKSKRGGGVDDGRGNGTDGETGTGSLRI